MEKYAIETLDLFTYEQIINMVKPLYSGQSWRLKKCILGCCPLFRKLLHSSIPKVATIGNMSIFERCTLIKVSL